LCTRELMPNILLARRRDNRGNGAMVGKCSKTSGFTSKTIFWVVFALLLSPLPATAGSVPGINTDQLKAKLEDKLHQALAEKIAGFEKTVAGWQEDNTFNTMALALSRNPAFKQAWDKAQTEGKTPKQSVRAGLRAAMRSGAEGTRLQGVMDDLLEGKSKAVLDDLGTIYSSAKSQLKSISGITKDVESAPDTDGYISTIKQYGVNGKYIDGLDDMEKRLTGISDKLRKRFETPLKILEIVHGGVTGNQLDSRTRASFALLADIGGTVPIIGEFVALYAKVAEELLNATMRLRKAFAKWEDGCIGIDGVRNITGKNNPLDTSFRKRFKSGDWACSEGSIDNLYASENDRGTLYWWSGEKWFRTRPGSVGTHLTLHRILAYYKALKRENIHVDDSISAAFKLYAIPGGFDNGREGARSLYDGVVDGWNDLASKGCAG